MVVGEEILCFDLGFRHSSVPTSLHLPKCTAAWGLLITSTTGHPGDWICIETLSETLRAPLDKESIEVPNQYFH